MVRNSFGPVQRRRVGDGELLVAVDPATQQLLKYEDVRPRGQGAAADDSSRAAGRMSLDTQLFSERDAAQIRSDLLDCQARSACVKQNSNGSKPCFSCCHLARQPC